MIKVSNAVAAVFRVLHAFTCATFSRGSFVKRQEEVEISGMSGFKSKRKRIYTAGSRKHRPLPSRQMISVFSEGDVYLQVNSFFCKLYARLRTPRCHRPINSDVSCNEFHETREEICETAP